MNLPSQQAQQVQLKLDRNLTALLNQMVQDGEVNTVERLWKEISNNFMGSELSLSLFIAALTSYKKDRCLRPFPQKFINQHGKNFGELKNVCDNIPPLSDFIKEPTTCPKEVTDFLTWLLLTRGYPKLKRVMMEDVPILNAVAPEYQPHFLFEVLYKPELEEAWTSRKGDREIIVAFHGSGLENFYSILKVGLLQHFSMERDTLFGNGIYLANDISISAHYSPYGPSWIYSELGHNQSIIAICEIINDVDKVKCQDSKNKRRALNEGGFGQIPERYFVVTDSDMVRVKYLMVYKKNNTSSSPIRSFAKNHMFVILLVVYVLLLLIIRLHGRIGKWINRSFGGQDEKQ